MLLVLDQEGQYTLESEVTVAYWNTWSALQCNLQHAAVVTLVGNWVRKPHSRVLDARQDLPLLCDTASARRRRGVGGTDDTWWLCTVHHTRSQTTWGYDIIIIAALVSSLLCLSALSASFHTVDFSNFSGLIAPSCIDYWFHFLVHFFKITLLGAGDA